MGKKNKQSAKSFKPEDYIRKKARLLPIYKCYKSINKFEDREISIIVIRQHPQGTYTFATYLIDKWCLGVKDSLWDFSIDEGELNDFLSYFTDRMSMEEIDYVEAHNWVYGAVAFAEDVGIKPCKTFALTQYILEEDDDDIELIEYEFGRDGRYCLVAKNSFEASKYIPTLDKNLGSGNYDLEIGIFGNDVYDDDVDDDYVPFKSCPWMEYTYKGKEYPKKITLKHPELDGIMSKNTEDITDEDIETVISLPAESAREDLQNLILREIGLQWGKTLPELQECGACNWNVIGNALIFLTKFATVEDSFNVVLEVMRQSEVFWEFNFCDISNILLNPLLCVLIKDNPSILKPFLLETGLTTSAKICAFELLKKIAQNCPKVKREIIDMTVDLLLEYKEDLPVRFICDGTVTAFAIGVLIGTNDVEHLSLIEELYATGMVDEECEGHIDEVRNSIKMLHPAYALPPMDLNSIMNQYKKLIKNS